MTNCDKQPIGPYLYKRAFGSSPKSKRTKVPLFSYKTTLYILLDFLHWLFFLPGLPQSHQLSQKQPTRTDPSFPQNSTPVFVKLIKLLSLSLCLPPIMDPHLTNLASNVYPWFNRQPTKPTTTVNNIRKTPQSKPKSKSNFFFFFFNIDKIEFQLHLFSQITRLRFLV